MAVVGAGECIELNRGGVAHGGLSSNASPRVGLGPVASGPAHPPRHSLRPTRRCYPLPTSQASYNMHHRTDKRMKVAGCASSKQNSHSSDWRQAIPLSPLVPCDEPAGRAATTPRPHTRASGSITKPFELRRPTSLPSFPAGSMHILPPSPPSSARAPRARGSQPTRLHPQPPQKSLMFQVCTEYEAQSAAIHRCSQV